MIFLTSKVTPKGSRVLKEALGIYNEGPNWMANESISVDYYRSCGYMHWFTVLGYDSQWKLEQRKWNLKNNKFCSAEFYFAVQKWSYKCLANRVVYGSQRRVGDNPFNAFTSLTFHGQLSFSIFGVINLIIMTRVVKQIDKNRTATLVLHQTEIVCDVLMVVKSHVALVDIINVLKYTTTGRYSLVHIKCSECSYACSIMQSKSSPIGNLIFLRV